MRLLWPFLALARRRGADDAAARSAAWLGLSQAELEDPDAFVPLQRLLDLLTLAIESTGDRDLGLMAATFAGSEHLGMTEYVARTSSTWGQALEATQRYAALLGDGVRFAVEVEGDRAYWRVSFDRDMVVPEAAREFAVALGVLSARRISGTREIAPLEVHFTHRPPVDAARHEQLFGCPVRFAMPFTQVAMSRSCLDTALSGADPTLARLLKQKAEAMLLAAPGSSDLAMRVRAVLQGERYPRDATAERTARRLGLGVRTLSRRLREEGTGYRELLDEHRAERARELLAQSGRSIASVADELGFASPQSFHRAFRRWTGTTAARYRLRVLTRLGDVPVQRRNARWKL